MKRFAQVISIVFSPIASLLTMTGLFLFLLAGKEHFLLTAAWLIFMCVVVPGIIYVWLTKKGKISDFDITKREERIRIYLAVLVAYLICLIGLNIMGEIGLFNALLPIWLLILVFFLVTLFWKISGHTGMVSGAWIFLMHFFGTEKMWWFGLGIVVLAWARVYLKKHTLAQSIGGIVMGILVTWIGLNFR